MELHNLKVIEHPAMSADEAWIVHTKDAPQVPHELRDQLPVPCILTGSKARAKQVLALLQAITDVSATTTTAKPRARGRRH